MASLLRLADADLKDAELLSSGRHPGNAPALLQLASERLVQAVSATELGWPLTKPGTDLTLMPSDNPLRALVSNLVTTGRSSGPPSVADDGSLPATPDLRELRANILAVRAILKNLAATFEVDLFGVGSAGKVSPVRPAAVPKPEKERRAANPVPLKLTRQRPEPRDMPPAKSSRDDVGAISASTRFVVPKLAPAPVLEPHEVEGRASIEVKQGTGSVASTPFWTLMDLWNIPDQAALDLIGHPGGLTKKGTRPRFRLAGEEAALLKSFQEIDAALRPLGLEPKTWLHQPIKAAPFDGATPAAYLQDRRKKGIQDILRFILQHGLRLSMSNGERRAE